MAENKSPPPLMTDKELLMETGAFNEIMNAAFEYADAYCASGDEPRRYSAAIDHLRKTVRAEITKFSRANYKTNASTKFDAQAVTAQAPSGNWINVADRLPPAGTPVLLDTGGKYPIRAMWAAKHTIEAGDDDTDWGEYVEADDMYYCPEGWYEWNAHEETHWSVSAKPIAWMPIPRATPALPATEDSSAVDLADWAIDVSAGREILVYKNCSVIEAEQAHLVLSLIRQAEVQAEPVADGEYLPLPMQYACSGPFPVYSAYQMREYADAHRKSATAPQAEQMVPEEWREQFAQAVYADLAAADNQDIPLEEYPGRILKVLDSIVGPHHPTVVHWRNDAIRACIEIVKRYGAGTTAYQERDMAALYTAPQAQPADALDAERWRALLACGRIRLFGTAGVNGSGIHDPSQLTPHNKPYGNYVHFGAEFWSTFPDQDYYNTKENPVYARATLTEFADACRAAMAAAQEGGNAAKEA